MVNSKDMPVGEAVAGEALEGPIKGLGFDRGGFEFIFVGDRKFTAEEVRRALSARPVEEPGVVDLWATVYGRAVSAEYEVKRLTLENNRLTDAAIDAEAALAETRERLEKVEAALRRSAQGWENALELGLLPEQHRETATNLRDEARAVLSTQESDTGPVK